MRREAWLQQWEESRGLDGGATQRRESQSVSTHDCDGSAEDTWSWLLVPGLDGWAGGVALSVKGLEWEKMTSCLGRLSWQAGLRRWVEVTNGNDRST